MGKDNCLKRDAASQDHSLVTRLRGIVAALPGESTSQYRSTTNQPVDIFYLQVSETSTVTLKVINCVKP